MLFRCATLFLACAVAGCIIHDSGAAGGGGAAVGGNMVPASSLRPLRQAGAAAHRRIGTALMSGRLSNQAIRTLVAREFDSLTPENEMKWESIEPSPGRFSFEAGDKLVAFAAENGIRMRGHTLVWHSQLAFWVKGLKADALRAAMTRHIQNVVGHWKGKIAQWDVVNEAIADGPTGELRSDSPFAVLGPNFIDEAFRLAHAADPDAQLMYNDYEIEGDDAKSNAAFNLCKRLKEAGVPIHGVGFQMHVDPRHWPTAETIQKNMERYAALGLAIEFTEMDVPVGQLTGATIEEKLNQQRDLTRDIVATCVAVSTCSGVTFWGVTDGDSWLNDPHWGQLRGKGPHHPLLFNTELLPKPMVAGVLEALEKKK